MRWSQALIETLRESPAEAEVPSHAWMLRAGLIRKVAAGLYDWLPLGLRVLRRVEQIIREEMDASGALEVLLPILTPAELWQETGRWQQYGHELFRLQDRHERSFALGPTHEEVMTDLVRRVVRSYRQLPVNLYQMHTKFRDEIRPRFGVMRAREFVMKDAYSFDLDDAGAEQSYQKMVATYHRIFQRCGLDFRAVEADSGNIGGSFSAEFMVLAETGEEGIASCPACQYAANVEKAPSILRQAADSPLTAIPPMRLVATPGKRTVEEVAAFLGVAPQRVAKTMLYVADDKPYAVVLRGDREVNEIKLKRLLQAQALRPASSEEILALTGAPAGFAGPFGLTAAAGVLTDDSLRGLSEVVTGGNAQDQHAMHVQPGRDFPVADWVDIKTAVAGDACPRCGGSLQIDRGIEVGHTFKLGTKYSQVMQARVLDQTGKERTCVMGCYGIGVSRIVAAAIEQHHDDKGIVWPASLAPYAVVVLTLSANQSAVLEAGERVYTELLQAGVSVLLDDRDERAGIKFKDAELLGFPIIVALGKSLAEGCAEVQVRRSGEKQQVRLDGILAFVAEKMKDV